MNKYLVTVFTDFDRREFSALATSWSDPKLNEIAETIGYVMVEETVPIDYILQVEGYDIKDYDSSTISNIITSTDMSGYFNVCIEPYEGTDFEKYNLIYNANEEA